MPLSSAKLRGGANSRMMRAMKPYAPLLLWLLWVTVNTSALHLTPWLDVLGFAIACLATPRKDHA